MKQPEALRLADAIDSRDIVSESDVAAELRRLCQSEREGWRYADELEQERKRLHVLNQELLEALKMFVAWSEAESNHKGTTFWERVEMLRELDAAADVAIAKATKES